MQKRGWFGRILHPFSSSEVLPTYNDPKLRGLILDLQVTPQPVKLSEIRQLEIKATLTNQAKRAITLEFPTDQRIEIYLLNSAQDALTKWSENHAFNKKPGIAWRKPVNELYPSDRIIQLAIQKGIRLTTASDAYSHAQLGENFERLADKMSILGARKMCVYAKHKRIELTFSRAGLWFWMAIVLGAAIRFYLVVFTEGTFDAQLWEGHSRDVIERGVVGCYHVNGSANHPPFISEIEAVLLGMSDATGISYRIFLRAPFALLDAAGAFVLLRLLVASPWRFVVAACYWLSPLAIILSAYHGNVDSAVGFFLLLSVWLLSKERTISAAAALGITGRMPVPHKYFRLSS